MKQIQPIYGLIAVLIIILLIFSYRMVIVKERTMPDPSPTPVSSQSDITAEEKVRIETWIKSNNLNFFGDPNDTVYAGGTPLYDEMSGETIDRFDYILKNHPDRPWNN